MEQVLEGDARAPALVIRLLGRFTVEAGERSVGPDGWRPRTGRHLLALLALAPDQAPHREQLADALWPEFEPAVGGGADLAGQSAGAADASDRPRGRRGGGGDLVVRPP